MKSSEYREMTADELIKEESELRSELFKLRFQIATNQLDNPMKLVGVKKSIAKVKTILREKSTAEQPFEKRLTRRKRNEIKAKELKKAK